MPINPPFQLYTPNDGERREFRIKRYELGEGPVNPTDGRASKVVPYLRIYVDPPPRTPPLDYWDLSGVRIQARLRPLLDAVIAGGKTLVLTRQGLGVHTDYTVEVK